MLNYLSTVIRYFISTSITRFLLSALKKKLPSFFEHLRQKHKLCIHLEEY